MVILFLPTKRATYDSVSVTYISYTFCIVNKGFWESPASFHLPSLHPLDLLLRQAVQLIHQPDCLSCLPGWLLSGNSGSCL